MNEEDERPRRNNRTNEVVNTARRSNDGSVQDVHEVCTAFHAMVEEKNKSLIKTIKVKIADVEAKALVDTGAICSILGYEYYQRLKCKYPSINLNVCGSEYATICTVDGSEIRKI